MICDNMLIFHDNTDAYMHKSNIPYPDLIWNDDDEYFIAIHPNSDGPEHFQFPMEVSVVPYEQIQYLKIDLDAKGTRAALALFGASEEVKKVTENMLSKVTTPKDLNRVTTTYDQTKGQFRDPNIK